MTCLSPRRWENAELVHRRDLPGSSSLPRARTAGVATRGDHRRRDRGRRSRWSAAGWLFTTTQVDTAGRLGNLPPGGPEADRHQLTLADGAVDVRPDAPVNVTARYGRIVAAELLDDADRRVDRRDRPGWQRMVVGRHRARHRLPLPRQPPDRHAPGREEPRLVVHDAHPDRHGVGPGLTRRRRDGRCRPADHRALLGSRHQQGRGRATPARHALDPGRRLVALVRRQRGPLPPAAVLAREHHRRRGRQPRRCRLRRRRVGRPEHHDALHDRQRQRQHRRPPDPPDDRHHQRPAGGRHPDRAAARTASRR